MTLTELKYLIAVAEEQHFGRAAERSHVSQPSLSAAVKNIEDELGVRVFERSKRGVAVTDVGAEIVAQARRTLEEAARITTVAKQGKNQLRGVLRLGVIHTIAPSALPRTLCASGISTKSKPRSVRSALACVQYWQPSRVKIAT